MILLAGCVLIVIAFAILIQHERVTLERDLRLARLLAQQDPFAEKPASPRAGDYLL